ALESHQEEEFAREKLKKKNFDLVVMNSLQDKGAGFAHDTNKITVYDTANNAFPFELKTKEAVARDILNLIVRKLNA
ncbi:MAG: phosphopantothenoylcysteine decarboxylase, partial [Cyclobacteriaceae bacterium]|nr:phosphopantothenoylcysteine decarboxylase [Cyclobacteriaceae bacterium]